ncbi:ATP-dependent helicase [Virgibacillus halodenitrificans]|uniref:ATP-dependent helicase n=1 Tax=Virgibacillus halodenitrificans TaxID=1482 RepID=UPI000EF4EBD8|nr:ATP-dependent helicase [Virgibacillus halodenitrificans]
MSFYKKIIDVFNQAPIAEKGSTLTSVDIVKDNERDTTYFRTLEQGGIRLNEKQIEAVRDTEGPLLIIAGAGSGKTTVLVSRIGYMLSVRNIPASDILLVTFTKKAAKEMKERIGRLPGITPKMKREIHTGTFHSIFLKILKEQGDKRKVLSNEKYKEIIIKKIFREMDVQDDYQPESILSLISYMKNQMVRPYDIEGETPIEKEFKEIYKKYETWKEDNNYLDFDDFLIETYYLLKFEPQILKYYQERFRYVMVDEFQDTSLVQYELMKLLVAPHNNFCVVGDDSQTIYGFRGAESDYILNFHKEFPTTTQVMLDINYRSIDSIVGLGNEVIKHNKRQIPKNLKSMQKSESFPMYYRPEDENEEARNVVDYIQGKVESGEKDYRDFSVIYRTHAVSRAIYDELVLRKIPFVTYGNNKLFYENTFVKPIIDILRLVENPNDEEAIISVAPVFYLKKDMVSKCLDQIAIEEELHQEPCGNRIKRVIKMLLNKVKPFQKQSLEDKLLLLQRMKEMTPLRAIQTIRDSKAFYYDKYLEMNKRKSLTFHKEMVIEILNELESSARKHNTISNYLAFIDDLLTRHKEMNELRQGENANVVKLMTIHQSKGLEFNTVFLIGLIENILPHKAALNADEQEDRVQSKKAKQKKVSKTEEAIEEERRLCYVAITRVKESLYLSAPKTHHNKAADESRFIIESLKTEDSNGAS